MRKILTAFAIAGMLVLSGCGYNDFQTRDEEVKAAWSEVINQYKRRADLIPNLVSVVQGFAAQEKGRSAGRDHRALQSGLDAAHAGGAQ
jgi:LemA protein